MSENKQNTKVVDGIAMVNSLLKPVQSISYADKIKDDFKWGKLTMEYYISTSNFRINKTERVNNKYNSLKAWYDAYNNVIDQELFSYVINPFNTENKLYKNFPAKIRPYNIIRPNIDLYIGEYNKKPFKYDVVNLDGEGVMNSMLESRYNKFIKNLEQRFVNKLNAEKVNTNQDTDKELPDPATIIDDFNTNYKDEEAIKGYKRLKLIESELNLKELYMILLKDYLISGEVYSIKFPNLGDIEYERLSPLWVDFDKGSNQIYIEDGDAACCKFRLTISQVLDRFYDELVEEDVQLMEMDSEGLRTRLFSTLVGNSDDKDKVNKIDVYYVTWKSRRKIGILKFNDPITGEELEKEVDEDYKVNKELGEEVEWKWVNQVWEGWRLHDKKYVGIRPVICQRSEIDNLSACKLPINGRRFSDTESNNVSIVSLGMPYQIMYIITLYRLELAVARSKGKVQLLDINTIPNNEDGGEDKFWYYSEALGYALIDRDQDGVDRSWNQYSTLDFSQKDLIVELMKMAEYYKASWDELLGITRQRKGETLSSDAVGNNNESIFRSTVISDIIFTSFDSFIEKELQGLLDVSKYAWINGKQGNYRADDGAIEFLNITSEEIATSVLGVFVDHMGRNTNKLDLLKAQTNAVAQRKDVKLSTIADWIWTDSYAELLAKLKKSEKIEAKLLEQQAQNEHERNIELENLKKEYAQFEKMLDTQFMEAQEDRLDNREYIKAEIEKALTNNGEINIDSILESSNKRIIEMEKIKAENRKTESAERIAVMKDRTERFKARQKPKGK